MHALPRPDANGYRAVHCAHVVDGLDAHLACVLGMVDDARESLIPALVPARRGREQGDAMRSFDRGSG